MASRIRPSGNLTAIGDPLTYVDNNAMRLYKVIYGNRGPKSYNGKLEPLSDEAIEKIYDLAKSTGSWSTLQGCVAVILGCAAGLRPQEARQLYVHDVHHLDENLHIHIRHVKGEGSWGRARDVPLNDDVSDIIEKYLWVREMKLRYRGMQSDAMFRRSDRTGNSSGSSP